MTAGPLMLDLEGYRLTDQERETLLHPMAGGVIFFSRNYQSREQLMELVAAVREIRPELLLAVDQEGGRVQRFRQGYTRIPSMQTLGELSAKYAERGIALVRDVGWLLASEVLATGLDFSFAPVLDVDRESCPVIGDRAFSDDPEVVSLAAGHFIDGLHEAGMAVTGKHFPGHGGVIGDSHEVTPHDSRDLETLRRRDLQPFAVLGEKLDAVMPAHIVFTRVDNQCVGFSRIWLRQILRGQLAFKGVIFSDDLSMRGADIAGDYAQKTELALEAGCDMVLVCNNPRGARQVLDWLDRADIEPSTRLPTMLARKAVNWSTLAADSRYQQTVDSLHALINGIWPC